jgi:uncharacterized protein (TIGR03083 family)
MNDLVAIRRESELFHATAESADPTLGVPSCPGWTIADLVWHLGEVHWFWATDVELRATEPESVERSKPARPGDYGDLLGWGRAQTARLLQFLDETPGDTRVWTWARDEADHTVAFVRRHQVQEAAVHRWDMQLAATDATSDPISPDVASDAIDEFLSATVPWGVRGDKPLSGSVHIHCTDTEGEWFLHADGRLERIHAKGDVAMRGTASDLILALYERVPLEALDVIGDTALARQLIDRSNTE